MKKTLLSLALLSLCASVSATNYGEHADTHVYGGKSNSTSSANSLNANVNTSNISNRNNNTSSSKANQSQTSNGGKGGAGGIGNGGMGGAGGSASNGSVNGSEANNANLQVNTTTPRQTAQAANVTVMPTAVCSGVTGGSVSTAVVGVSLGTSWTDSNCILLEQVRTTAAILDDVATAAEMMCGVEAYRDARARMGKPCATKLATNTGAPSAQVEYTDPIIRARLGLPPLN